MAPNTEILTHQSPAHDLLESCKPEPEAELTEEEMDELVKQAMTLFVSMTLKTVDKDVLNQVNVENRTWKKDLCKIFGVTQKTLSSEILDLSKQGKTEVEIVELLTEYEDDDKDELDEIIEEEN